MAPVGPQAERKGGFSPEAWTLKASGPCLPHLCPFLLRRPEPSATPLPGNAEVPVPECPSARGSGPRPNPGPVILKPYEKALWVQLPAARRPSGQSRGGDKTQPFLPASEPPAAPQECPARGSEAGVGCLAGPPTSSLPSLLPFQLRPGEFSMCSWSWTRVGWPRAAAAGGGGGAPSELRGRGDAPPPSPH